MIGIGEDEFERIGWEKMSDEKRNRIRCVREIGERIGNSKQIEEDVYYAEADESF